MAAYLLILLAIFTRLAPHPAWLNFTAVGSGLLFFGARRPLSQAILPVAALAATDYYLTVFAYSYPFHVSPYLLTWAWYAAVILLGHVLLAKNVSVVRLATAIVAAPTSFFLLTNFQAWLLMPQLYPRSMGGLGLSYIAGLPFYRNDVLSTAVVVGLAFGIPAIAGRVSAHRQVAGV
jgi:hypothetical protein